MKTLLINDPTTGPHCVVIPYWWKRNNSHRINQGRHVRTFTVSLNCMCWLVKDWAWRGSLRVTRWPKGHPAFLSPAIRCVWVTRPVGEPGALCALPHVLSGADPALLLVGRKFWPPSFFMVIVIGCYIHLFSYPALSSNSNSPFCTPMSLSERALLSLLTEHSQPPLQDKLSPLLSFYHSFSKFQGKFIFLEDVWPTYAVFQARTCTDLVCW